MGGWDVLGNNALNYEDWHLWMDVAEAGRRGLHAGASVPTYHRRMHGVRRLDAVKRSHVAVYGRLRDTHRALFSDIREHRERSDLSRSRKLLYPLIYGGRRRFSFEGYVKALLDRVGVWTLRR